MLRADRQLAAALRLNAEFEAAAGPAPTDPVEARAHAARVRSWWNEGGPAVDVAREVLPGPLRPVPVAIYRPQSATGLLPAYIYLHGGAFRLGHETWNDRQMREIAQAWGGIVVSADYAHVPENVFPDAVIECAAVYQALHEGGSRFGIDGDRLAFGGSSAGANVALGAAIHLGAGATSWLRAAAFIVGLFDHPPVDAAPTIEADLPVTPGIDGIRASLARYVPSAAQRSDPRVECISADPALIPPAFFAAAEIDELRESSRRMAARLSAAGRRATYREYPGMTHLFFGYSRLVDRSAECAKDVAAFLSAQLPTSGN